MCWIFESLLKRVDAEGGSLIFFQWVTEAAAATVVLGAIAERNNLRANFTYNLALTGVVSAIVIVILFHTEKAQPHC